MPHLLKTELILYPAINLTIINIRLFNPLKAMISQNSLNTIMIKIVINRTIIILQTELRFKALIRLKKIKKLATKDICLWETAGQLFEIALILNQAHT